MKLWVKFLKIIHELRIPKLDQAISELLGHDAEPSGHVTKTKLDQAVSDIGENYQDNSCIN